MWTPPHAPTTHNQDTQKDSAEEQLSRSLLPMVTNNSIEPNSSDNPETLPYPEAMIDEPVVDDAENDEPEGESELLELRRNKFVWQAGDIQIIKGRE